MKWKWSWDKIALSIAEDCPPVKTFANWAAHFIQLTTVLSCSIQ